MAAAAPAPPSCCDCRSPAPGKERDGHWLSQLPALTCHVDAGTRGWPQGLGRQGPGPFQRPGQKAPPGRREDWQ